MRTTAACAHRSMPGICRSAIRWCGLRLPPWLSLSLVPLLLASSACHTSATVSGGGETVEKVAVIDIQAIFERSQSGKQALAALLEEFGEERRRLTHEEDALKQEAIALEQDRRALGPDQLHEQTERYLTRLERYRVQVQSYNQELTVRHRALVASYLPKIVAVARPLAEREGYSTVLHQGRPETVMIVFYHAPEIDLTDRVIAELDRVQEP